MPYGPDDWEGTGMSLRELAESFAKSGYYRDATRPEQVLVKLLMGKELGLSMLASMAGLQIVEGKPELAAGTLAALIKKSGKYDFRIKEHTNEGCTLVFYQLKPEKEILGEVTYALDDAKRAGLAGRTNWTRNPSDMYFARAVSRGYRRHTPDAASLTTIYVEGEIDQKAFPGAGKNGEPETEAEQDARNPFMPALDDMPAPGRSPEAQAEANGEAEDAKPRRTRKGGAPSPAPTASQGPSSETSASQEEGVVPPAASSVIDQETGEVLGPPAPPDPGEDWGPQVFTYNGVEYRTKGLTIEQFADASTLLAELAKLTDSRAAMEQGKEAIRAILGRYGSRVDLTREQGEMLLKGLQVHIRRINNEVSI
jgi:hypothetical protein